jgi:hypothetical protein
MKKRKAISHFLFIACILAVSYSTFAQNVGVGTSTPHTGASEK